MDIINKLIYKTLEKNERFKDLHKNQDCIIFGNGGSIKYYNLSDFNFAVGIGVNFFPAHNEFKHTDFRYHVIPENVLFYPFKTNPWNNKFGYNYLGLVSRKTVKKHKKVLFTSISNALGILRKKTYYLHHFGLREIDISKYDISRKFSFMGGSLQTAIGLAIYMGFSKAYLVGCDYLITPQIDGHFYSKIYSISDRNNLVFPELQKLKEKIELIVVTPENMESKYFNFITYKNLTGHTNSFRENVDIVDTKLYKYFKLAYQNGWINEV